MALVVTNAGEVELLNKLIRNTTADNEDYILHLYQNNYSPVDGSTAGDFTESNFTNYVAKTIARSDWSAATIVSDKAESTCAVQSWTCGTTGNTVYGYYIIGGTSSVLLWAEKFAAQRILADGDILNLTPKFNIDSANH
jgi:hypothetical protein